MKEQTLVLILAGGQSRRMGTDKAALPFGDETMLASLVRRFQGLCPVAVSLRTAGQFDTAGAGEIVDRYPGQGPLAGLQAAFAQTEAERIFLTGTDLPFLSVELASALLDAAENSQGGDAWVIQRSDGKMEPLCGVYSRRCAKPAEECLREGRRSFRSLFQRVDVRYIPESALPGFDLEHQLDNLNTPEDYQRAVVQWQG
ncbi:MAG: molybdenum cofactor guanylyltransferase [Oscillospiraceae bacterium]|nr:molybdenum cofactor guanylyltransferase [Oscillospiraceae bacterium]